MKKTALPGGKKPAFTAYTGNIVTSGKAIPKSPMKKAMPGGKTTGGKSAKKSSK